MAVFNWQFQLGSLLMGDGTSYDVSNVVGLESMPALTTSDTKRPRAMGMLSGTAYTQARVITMDVEFTATDDVTFRNLLEALKAAAAPEQDALVPFAFQLPGMGANRNALVDPRALDVPLDLDYKFRRAAVPVQLYAPDPRLYSATSDLDVFLADPASGFTFPLTFPLTFGNSPSGGTFQVVNAGNARMEPVATFYGPVDQPRIENVTSGRTVAFNITLSSTDYLVVDFKAKTVMLNGTVGRRGTLAYGSQWFDLAPGTNNLNFRANTYQAGAKLTFSSASAWV